MGQHRWEEFAREDAEFYIYSVDVDYSTPEGRQFFFESGERDAENILSQCRDVVPSYELAVEIGCGVGRVGIAMAKHFDSVIGVDVSPTMIAKLAQNAETLKISNISGLLDNQEWDRPDSADLIYSYLVFQHIEDEAIIEGYFPRVAQALKPGGVAFFQFDTRAASLTYRLKMLLPDLALPRTWRRGIRRVRRDPKRLRKLFASHGLRVLRESGEDSEDHAFLLGRAK